MNQNIETPAQIQGRIDRKKSELLAEQTNLDAANQALRAKQESTLQLLSEREAFKQRMERAQRNWAQNEFRRKELREELLSHVGKFEDGSFHMLVEAKFPKHINADYYVGIIAEWLDAAKVKVATMEAEIVAHAKAQGTTDILPPELK